MFHRPRQGVLISSFTYLESVLNYILLDYTLQENMKVAPFFIEPIALNIYSYLIMYHFLYKICCDYIYLLSRLAIYLCLCVYTCDTEVSA